MKIVFNPLTQGTIKGLPLPTHGSPASYRSTTSSLSTEGKVTWTLVLSWMGGTNTKIVCFQFIKSKDKTLR